MHKCRSLLTVSSLSGVDPAIKAAMRQVCKEDGRSREELVDALNELADAAGVRITGGNAQHLALPTFEKWLSPAATDQMPSPRALVLFCEVTADVRPLSVMAEPLGARVIDQEEARVLQVAEIEQEIKLLKKRKKMLEAAR